MNVGRRTLVALGAALALGFPVFTGDGHADGNAQPLPLSQSWTNVSLITLPNDWSGVPGIIGYRGDDLTTATGTDPQTILADGTSTPVNVLANQTNPNTNATGAVAEFDTLANPVVALQGSGTADAPFILLHLNTTGVNSVQVAYNLRDIDGSTDNAIQPVALQFRVGSTGNFTNVPAGFVADATTGGTATLVTPVSVVLPAVANDQPLVQVRIITTNAVGNDEWVGVDDINVTAAAIGPSGSGNASPNNPFAGDNTLLTVATQQGTPPAAITSVVGDLTAIGQTNAQLFFDDGTNGDVTAGDGTYSVLTSVAPATTAGPKVIPTVITDALARTGSAPIQLTVQSNSTAPSGVGAANPSTVPPGSGTLLTVSVTPGANPASTGLTVIGDLTAIGQTNAQLFFDDGTNGDVTAGDNVFSVAATVAPTTPVGGKSLPATITDDQNRTGTTTISLIVGDVVPPVVISQVYGGGGEAGAPFRNDFVELFNRGASPADLSTWSLQYASATGTTWDVTPLSGILQPGRYYLVQLASSGSVGAGLPAPNATGTTDVAFAAGKVLLLSTATPQTGACPSSQVVDLVGYGAADCFEGMSPAPTGTAATADVRLLKGCADNNNNAADFTRDVPTPRNGSTAALDCSLPQPPAATLRPIDQVQGAGSSSPFVGQVVRVRGVVTGRTSNTFFLQTPDGAAEADADPATSEGIIVFTSTPPTVNAGDFVEVTGTVEEFIPGADLASPPKTEIAPAGIVVFSSGNALPAATVITADDTSPSGTIEQLEKFEGMRVSVPSLTVIAPTAGNVNEANATSTSTGVFYGVVTGVARPFREPGIEVPDPLPPGAPPSIPRFDANPERLRVDSDLQTGAAQLNVAAGAVVTGVVGPLDYSFRTYTIAPDPSAPPTVTGGGSATPVPAPAISQFTVASFNMERFFDTVNDPGTSDVVLTATAFNNRLNKASLTIRNILRTPDILGVQEMENLSTLQALATKINNDAVAAGDPSPAYTAILMEGNDIGGIDVGFLVKSTRVAVVDVTQVGKDATYIDPSTGQPALLNDRPSLVLRALVHPLTSGSDFPVTVIVNHLRSLSGVDDPVDGNRIRTKRRAQAEFLANLIQARQVADPTERIVSVGDYNAFGFNDGYVDSMGTIRGQPTPPNEVLLASPDLVSPDLVSVESLVPSDQRYSFTFDGNAQELDHAIATQNVINLVAAAARARVNADFAEILRGDSTRPERLSDHDPLVAYVNLPVLTQTSVVSSLNPSTFGQPVTFTAAVSAGATPVTTGNVTFKDGTTVLGTVALNASGQAAFTTSALSGGDHTISANFEGTSTLDASSASLVQTVNGAATNTAVASSANPSGQGQAVTFTATVTRGATPVTEGSVTFREGAIVLAGPINLNGSGQASFTISSLSVGSHSIRADFSGTPSSAASNGSVAQVVQPALILSDVTVLEGNTPFTVAAVFTVSLSTAAAEAVTVGFATQNGTATAGSDYEARSGQLLFPAGTTTRRVVVVIVSDTVVEPDEAFSLQLSGAVNAVIVDPTGAGVILNDDQVTVPTLSIGDVTVREKEGGSVAVFAVTLSSNPGQAVTVAYETADGTAVAPGDYLPRSGTLTFTPGTLSQTIEVPVNADNVAETREVFYVVLSSPSNATLADALGIGTIVSAPHFPGPGVVDSGR